MKYYLENFDWDKLTEGDTKVKGKTLNKEKLNVVPVPIPPLTEQHRIVAILDQKFAQIDVLKTTAQKNLENTKQLWQSELGLRLRSATNSKTASDETFPVGERSRTKWEKVRLGDVCDTCLGKMLDKNKNKGTPQPYLANINVRWGSFDLDNLSLMKFEDDEDERYGLKYGDLIVCEGGEPGRCAIWKDELPNMKIQKALHRIRCHKGLNNFFLYYFFLYQTSAEKLQEHFTGTTIKHLPGEKLKNLNLPLPPLPEQKSIVQHLDLLNEKIKQLQAIYTKQIADCEELKQSFLQKAFAASL